jgi:hypothetical protein
LKVKRWRSRSPDGLSAFALSEWMRSVSQNWDLRSTAPGFMIPSTHEESAEELAMVPSRANAVEARVVHARRWTVYRAAAKE